MDRISFCPTCCAKKADSDVLNRYDSGDLQSDSPLLNPSGSICAPTLHCLGRFARCVGQVIGSSPAKTVAGGMLAVALKNDWMGDYAPAEDTRQFIGIAGAMLWSISTALSTYNRPKGEGIVQKVAESVGYTVGGVVLVPARAIEYCLTPKSKVGDDPNPLGLTGVDLESPRKSPDIIDRGLFPKHGHATLYDGDPADKY